MKEKDIHEDYEKQQLIMYVEKDDGTYGAIQTGSYLTKNYLDDFWLKKRNLEKKLSEQLRNNEISAVYYYMLLNELSVAELAARTGIRKCRVKKHLRAKGFPGIRVKELQRYAHVFNIPVANLFQVIVYEEMDEIRALYIKEHEPETLSIVQKGTDNPSMVFTVIKSKK